MTDRKNFLPTATLENLKKRAALLESLRLFFRQHDFLEVQTPILSADTVVDRYLEPFQIVTQSAPDFSPQKGAAPPSARRYLQTSPEFGMKRLLIGGLEKIYQITHAFRQDETGPLHNSEFTMVEWYRCGDDQQAAIDLLADLTQNLLNKEVQQTTYADLFLKHIGLNPHVATVDQLKEATTSYAIPDYLLAPSPQKISSTLSTGHQNKTEGDDGQKEDWLNWIFAELIQNKLGRERPLIVNDYPACQAALARTAKQTFQEEDGKPKIITEVAERFELFVDGIELANGYHELLDPEVLAMRNERVNDFRELDGRERLPEESYLLQGMKAGLPPCSGVALGFDRLAMVAFGLSTISEILPFPDGRA
ncbi:MAG: EF-P lysine aminoacylase EpmA [Pirellulaceae bacterium]|nr:EF-P lysine aminoacylase EpmA [Pirellulaceae bacterium]